MSRDEAPRAAARPAAPEAPARREAAVEETLGRELRRMSVLQQRAALDRRRRRRRPGVRPLTA